MNLLIGIVTFITVVLLIEGGYLAVTAIYNPERKRVQRRLRALASRDYGSATVDITRKQVLSEIPWLNHILVGIPLTRYVGRLLEQANCPYRLSLFLLFSTVLFLVGLLVGPLVLRNTPLAMGGAICLWLTPFWYVYRNKQQRMRRFERQLPEALDLVARALKAGHTFLLGIKMIGDEFPDPIGTEFEKTVDEINFGASVPEALKNLTDRVDCPDLRFFVTSVIVQRETGGNLAEILEKTSQLIRQRFELHGRIRVLAAEGKLSAIILVALPILAGLGLYFINRDYLMVLFTDPMGKALMVSASLTMAMGILVMRNMVRIKV